MPPFNHDDYSISPIRRSNERGDSSEMEEDERPRSLNGSENNLKDKFKCAICDFETVSQDIYRNHMVLHATKDQDSPPPTSLPMHLPTPPIGKKLCLKNICPIHPINTGCRLQLAVDRIFTPIMAVLQFLEIFVDFFCNNIRNKPNFLNLEFKKPAST